MDLKNALVPAKLTSERTEMIEAARHQGREPAAGLVLRLLELHRQIDIADLERAARIGAEDPDLTHPRQVPALAGHDASEKTVYPLRRLGTLHMARVDPNQLRAMQPVLQISVIMFACHLAARPGCCSPTGCRASLRPRAVGFGGSCAGWAQHRS